jgi:hypothetical protein
MTDGQRIDFLADLMNLSVLREMGAMLPGDDLRRLDVRSRAVFQRYELHRRDNDTPTAFRLAVDDAAR